MPIQGQRKSAQAVSCRFSSRIPSQDAGKRSLLCARIPATHRTHQKTKQTAIVQWIEQNTPKVKTEVQFLLAVPRACSSSGRVLQWHCKGSRFDPGQVHHKYQHERAAQKPTATASGHARIGQIHQVYSRPDDLGWHRIWCHVLCGKSQGSLQVREQSCV
jgi:hypothetical protein